MKVAITGANGFLGSYLVKECLKQNFQVIALIRRGANLKSLPPESESFSVRILDYHSNLKPQFENVKEEFGSLDFLIHNAGVTVSLDKQEYFDINAKLTKQLLKALEESAAFDKNGKYVHISSYAAHGPKGINRPVSLYGESKKQAEESIQSSKLNNIIFRPTAIYGAGDYAFLPLFRAAKKGIYPLTNSSQKMSMIHASDLARIVVSEMVISNGIIHVNDGNTYTHQDFINSLENVLKRKIRKISIPTLVSKFSLRVSDFWHSLTNKRPGLTLEKFEEISKDWDLHESNLPHSKIKANFSLEKGFEDAYNFYKTNRLL